MGRADVELNDTGREQAIAMRDKLKDAKFSVILSSPLKRAKETAEIITEFHPGTPIVVADELIERDFGEYEGQVHGGGYFGLWDYGSGKSPDRGESLLNLAERVFPFLDRIREEYKGKDILLVTHGGLGVMIEEYYRGRPDSGNLLEYVMGTGELRIFDNKD